MHLRLALWKFDSILQTQSRKMFNSTASSMQEVWQHVWAVVGMVGASLEAGKRLVEMEKLGDILWCTFKELKEMLPCLFSGSLSPLCNSEGFQDKGCCGASCRTYRTGHMQGTNPTNRKRSFIE